jgi:hypothetical protein
MERRTMSNSMTMNHISGASSLSSITTTRKMLHMKSSMNRRPFWNDGKQTICRDEMRKQRIISIMSLSSSSSSDQYDNNSHSNHEIPEQESNNNEVTNDHTTPSLLIGNMDQYMNELRRKYPTTENAYLAASKLRAIQKTPSRIDTATDDDWYSISQEKKQQMMSDDDDDLDWKRSQDAFNDNSSTNESRILFFPDSAPSTTNKDGDENDDENNNNNKNDEPKLLLF